MSSTCSVPSRRARPLLAGLCLGCLMAHARPPTPLVGLFFAVEALRRYRAATCDARHRRQRRATRWCARCAGCAARDSVRVLKAHAWFALPVAAAIGVAAVVELRRASTTRSSSATSTCRSAGATRIDDVGPVQLPLLPARTWRCSPPACRGCRPAALREDQPARPRALVHHAEPALDRCGPSASTRAPSGLLAGRVPIAVAIPDLCYQNSGWIQFGYRFALDYMPLLIVLLALGRRRFGPGFYACLVFAVAVNAFGAAHLRPQLALLRRRQHPESALSARLKREPVYIARVLADATRPVGSV